MTTGKLKLIAIAFILILLIVLGFFIYRLGQANSKIECKEAEIQVQEKTVEVIKYVYKQDVKELLKPNKTFKELLERMKNGEI